jgi:hypothetical protein
MRGDKKGIRQKPGQFLKIPLGDGTFAYCQMVSKTDHAFFDYRDDGVSPIIEKILQSKMIFKCTVDSYVINKGYWEIIDRLPVKEEHLIDQDLFSYNSFTNTYQIFKDGIGDVPATWEEVQNLEVFASWGYYSVEQRLRDHFAGRPNHDVECFRAKDRNSFPKPEAFYKQYGCVLIDEENWVYAPPGTKVTYD